MRQGYLLAAIYGFLSLPNSGSAAEVIYSNTHGTHCRQLVEQGELSTYTCRGPKGRSMTVVDAGMIGGIMYGVGQKREEWQPATRIAGDGIGKKVEWRSLGGSPYAAIHRMHTPDGSVLVLTVFSGSGGCHAGYIDGAVPGANAKAAELADSLRDRFRCGVDRAVTVGRKIYGIAS